jgi:CRISPR-associated protein Csm3
MSLRLEKYVKIQGILHCKTGLRVGGSKEELEIGVTDNPVLRHPITDLPYIPGSSIKGKLRALLEYRYNRVVMTRQGVGEPCSCARRDCPVCFIFGPHKTPKHDLGPTRILVRDATLADKSVDWLGKLQEEGQLYVEVKSENIIDRATGVAAPGGLRTMERIPAGAEFEFRIVLRVFEGDDEERMVGLIGEGLKMLEDDYLGGSGSRGYGEVELRGLKRDEQPWML